ncbi:MAG: Thioredoxin C-1 [Firmicutes bacterium ADurb.Bin193]|nr:MAG: Thioredoxin C-1 [Firmicutes bacterium ADurb.Bin193]
MATIEITKDNFDSEVINSDKPVLLDFWAEWCGPCRMVGPIIDEIAEEVTHAKVGKVNVDEQPELAASFKVMSIPTIIVIKNGKVVNSVVGARPKQALLDLIK